MLAVRLLIPLGKNSDETYETPAIISHKAVLLQNNAQVVLGRIGNPNHHLNRALPLSINRVFM